MKRIDWTRRDFLKTASMMAGAGYLQPVLKLIEAGKTIEGAYPEEVLHVEAYTKGKVKPGMIISKDNVELIKEIAPEGLLIEIKRGCTKIKIGETTLEAIAPPGQLPRHWIEATLRNKGLARLDDKGQLWTRDGKPWIGGAPFPEPKTALECMWNFGADLERADDYSLASGFVAIDTNGTTLRHDYWVYQYIQVTGRLVLDPKPYNPAFGNDLYRNKVMFFHPEDAEGLQVLSVIYYDASRLPETYVYVPALRRVRHMPSTRRFEPDVPYAVAFTTDYNVYNDPILTWSWKLIGSKPMLQLSQNRGLFGPPEDFSGYPFPGQKIPNTTWELRPEVALVDGVCHLEGGDVYSRKRLYLDSVWMWPLVSQVWDKSGKLWKLLLGNHSYLDIPTHVPGSAVGASFVDFIDLQTDMHELIPFAPKNQWTQSTINTGLSPTDYLTPQALLKWTWR